MKFIDKPVYGGEGLSGRVSKQLGTSQRRRESGSESDVPSSRHSYHRFERVQND